MINTVHNRVGFFHSVEVQTEASPGQWIRVDKLSTQPLAKLVNDFLEVNNLTVVQVSTPTITPIATEDSSLRTYRCSVSVIYQPSEVIHDETIQGTNHAAQAQSKEISLDHVPEAFRGQILRTLEQEGITKPRNDSGSETSGTGVRTDTSSGRGSRSSRKTGRADGARASNGPAAAETVLRDNIRSSSRPVSSSGVPKLPRIS